MADSKSELERKFHQEMLNIYDAAQKLGYRPSHLLSMVSEKGGYEAAKQLICSTQPTEGFLKLWELKRLDITVEAKVLLPEYHDLFTDEEREICRKRLEEYGHPIQR